MNVLITGAWSEAEKYLAQISEMGLCVSFLKNEKDPLPLPYEKDSTSIWSGCSLLWSVTTTSCSSQRISLMFAGDAEAPSS